MYAIVDCNSFYCSCERVFKPFLESKPVVVLSNNDGCIISRSDEAKKLGIGMAGPFFMAKPIIEKNNVAVFSSNYNLYGDMSRRVMETLCSVMGEENVEVYSVDEAFLQLDAVSEQQLEPLLHHLKYIVETWTGVAVSVGAAPTKTLAKLANHMAKAHKKETGCVKLLHTKEQIDDALRKTPVGELWGIGRQYAEKLRALNIYTAWELSLLPEEWIRKFLGGVIGVRLLKELKGEEAITMEEPLTTKKAIATTRMFGTPVMQLSDIKEAVATYTSRAAEKLRRQRSAANMLSVFVVPKEEKKEHKFRHGPMLTSYAVLPGPTSITNALIKPAVQLAEKLYEEGRLYKKAGVILSGLVPDDSIQANLFEPQKSIGRFLMEQIDNINFSMRGDMVKFASSGTKRDWKMRQDYQSERYTTRWDELCEVR
jgi:DNA polymerase V